MSANQAANDPKTRAAQQARITARLAALRPGDRVAGFELIEPLTARESPTIWKAVDPTGAEVVVLKFAHRAGPPHPAVEPSVAFDHPHAPRVSGTGESGGVRFEVTPFIAGRTMASVMASRGRCDSMLAVSLIQKLAWTVASAHREGWCHGRVRPEHVLLEAETHEPMLLAMPSVAADPECERNERERLDRLRYWPPERFDELHWGAMAAPTRPADDQWALGVMLYELLTGRPPFSGATVDELAAAVTQSPPAGEFPGNVHPDVRTIALQALAKQPEDRLPSCGELCTALSKWLDAEQERRRADDDEQRRQEALGRVEVKHRREFWRLAVAMIFISILVGFFVAFRMKYGRSVDERGRARAWW